MGKLLNAKQRLFVSHYIIDRNATKAAIAAGYPKAGARTQGPRLLQNVAVARAVELALTKLVSSNELKAADVLGELRELAFHKVTKKQIRTSDKVKALEMLAKHFKLLTEVHEHSGKDGQPLVTLTMPANGSEKKPEPKLEEPPPLKPGEPFSSG